MSALAPNLRKYQEAWNQLRDSPTGSIRLAAPKEYHRRIYKALTKEKDLDLVYKMLCAELGMDSRLSKMINGNELTVKLRKRFTQSD